MFFTPSLLILTYYQAVTHFSVLMKIFISILLIFVISLAHCEESLEQTMLKLDAELFDSFNK